MNFGYQHHVFQVEHSSNEQEETSVPFKMLRNRKTKFKDLHVFGIDAYSNTPK